MASSLDRTQQHSLKPIKALIKVSDGLMIYILGQAMAAND